jgi:hypothetical protein
MDVRTAKLLSVCAVVLLAAGCYKNPTIAIPQAPQHLYVADFFGGFAAYTAPLGPASTPTANHDILGGGGGVAFDANGLFYVSAPQSVLAYNAPASSASMPTLTIGPIPGSNNLLGIAFDAAGTMYVADAASSFVYIFTRPLGSATPTFSLLGPPPFEPTGVAVDRAGAVYVANFKGSTIEVFRPPFSNGVNTPVAIMTIAKSTPIGLGIDRQDRLVAGLLDGELAVINPPFATGVTPAFYVAPPTINGGIASDASAMAFDTAGNVYVPYGSGAGPNSGIAVFSQPLAPTSQALFSFHAGMVQPLGAAYGP